MLSSLVWYVFFSVLLHSNLGTGEALHRSHQEKAATLDSVPQIMIQNIHTYTLIQTHTYTYPYTHTHTHAHTYTHIHLSFLLRFYASCDLTVLMRFVLTEEQTHFLQVMIYIRPSLSWLYIVNINLLALKFVYLIFFGSSILYIISSQNKHINIICQTSYYWRNSRE